MIQYSKNTKILSERQTKPCTTTQKSKAKILPSRGHAGTREQVPDVDVGQQGQQQYGYEYCRHVGRCYADAKIVKAVSSKTSLLDFNAEAHPARTRSTETGDTHIIVLITTKIPSVISPHQSARDTTAPQCNTANISTIAIYPKELITHGHTNQAPFSITYLAYKK